MEIENVLGEEAKQPWGIKLNRGGRGPFREAGLVERPGSIKWSLTTNTRNLPSKLKPKLLLIRPLGCYLSYRQ